MSPTADYECSVCGHRLEDQIFSDAPPSSFDRAEGRVCDSDGDREWHEHHYVRLYAGCSPSIGRVAGAGNSPARSSL